jgi:hypothetical protein
LGSVFFNSLRNTKTDGQWSEDWAVFLCSLIKRTPKNPGSGLNIGRWSEGWASTIPSTVAVTLQWATTSMTRRPCVAHSTGAMSASTAALCMEPKIQVGLSVCPCPCLLPLHQAWRQGLVVSDTETNKKHLVLFGMQSMAFGPYSAAINMFLISVVRSPAYGRVPYGSKERVSSSDIPGNVSAGSAQHHGLLG